MKFKFWPESKCKYF